MKRFITLLIMLVSLAPFALADKNENQGSKTNALAEFEFGGDSSARRYFRPSIKFEFNLFKQTNLFFSLSPYQVANKKLSGLVDFWIRGGILYNISDTADLEVSVNHMSRHITNFNTPYVFDVNDFIARAWFQMKKNLRIGFGGGLYLGDRWRDYGSDNLLLVGNLSYMHILGSEFSAIAEAKLINFNELLWEFELSAELNPNVDLFVKNIKHYPGYWPNPIFYFGLRLKNNAEEANDSVTKVKFRPSFYLGSDKYRGHSEQGIYFEFLKKETTAFALALNFDIHIFRGATMFAGTYRPETMNYFPLRLEYEKKIKNIYAGVYCGNQVIQPMDVKAEPTTTISFGFLLRNQHHFEDLQRSLRYELLVGKNFQRSYELSARVGLNTTHKKVNFGIDAQLLAYSSYEQKSLELFSDFALPNQIHIRPFAELRNISSNGSTGYFSLGVSFLKF